MESPAKRAKAPIDPWQLSGELRAEARAKGVQAAYDMLLQRLDDLADWMLIFPILEEVEIPAGAYVPQRIKSILQLRRLRKEFQYEAQSELDFGRTVDGFNQLFSKARALPTALFHEFMLHAAHAGHWGRCAPKVMAAFATIDNPPLDDADFAHIRCVFETKSQGEITARMLRAVPKDASPRMKAMIGSIGIKSTELEEAIEAYLASSVDPLTVEGANKTLCAIVRLARESVQQ